MNGYAPTLEDLRYWEAEAVFFGHDNYEEAPGEVNPGLEALRLGEWGWLLEQYGQAPHNKEGRKPPC